MDSIDLSFFSAVARTGSITKAAAQLATVQSNVTQRIQRLEQKLGVPLFHRHGRGMTLTTAGAQLLPYACNIEQIMEEASRATLERSEPSGPLTIGSMETTAALRLPDILVQYAGDFPSVDITLRTGTSKGLIEDVLARSIEGALVAGPVDHVDLVAEPVGTEELVIVTAPWVSIFGLSSMWSSLAETKMIVFRNGCSYRDKLERVLLRRGVTKIRMMELGTLEGILGCVRAGIGITLLPKAVVEPLIGDGRLAIHSLPDQTGMVETLFIRRRDAFISVSLAAFLVCVKEQFSSKDYANSDVAESRTTQ